MTDAMKATLADLQQAARAEDARQRWEKSSFFVPNARGGYFENDDAPDSEASRLCRSYAEKWPEMEKAGCGLLLMGPMGTGKTFYAAAIMHELLKKGVSAALVSAARLVELTMNGRSAEVIDELNGFRLVILDDFGAERDSDYALQQLEMFADARYASKKPLIVTTNLTKTQLDDTSDLRRARICDRVKELACVPVILTGESRRGKLAAERSRQMRALLTAG